MFERGERSQTEFKYPKVKKENAISEQNQGEQKSKGCKMKTLAKVQGRTEQLLGCRVDKVSVFSPRFQHCSDIVMDITNFNAKVFNY